MYYDSIKEVLNQENRIIACTEKCFGTNRERLSIEVDFLTQPRRVVFEDLFWSVNYRILCKLLCLM